MFGHKKINHQWYSCNACRANIAKSLAEFYSFLGTTKLFTKFQWAEAKELLAENLVWEKDSAWLSEPTVRLQTWKLEVLLIFKSGSL